MRSSGRTMLEAKAYPELFKAWKGLPSGPGVYKFLDQEGQVLYVGKAKNLQRRVGSYLTQKDTRSQVGFLLSKARGIDWVLTGNEKEALLLEDELIKRFRPRYNIRFRDDKTYISLVIDLSHSFPRPCIQRRPKAKKNQLILGPYPSGGVIRDLLHLLEPVFPVRTCSDTEFRNRVRPCLKHGLGLCSAPCVELIDQDAYARLLKGIVSALRGRLGELKPLFKEQIERYAERCEFEKAAQLRDRLKMLEQALQVQHVVVYQGLNSADVWALAQQGRLATAYRLCLREGRLEGGLAYHGQGLEVDPKETLTRLLTDAYAEGSNIPSVLYVPFLPEGKDALKELLSQRAGLDVKILTPPKAIPDVLALMAQAEQNARQRLLERLDDALKAEREILDLRMALRLPGPPKTIAGFDVSNLLGQDIVASMVVFREGRPSKEHYRHFIVRSVKDAPNDFLSIKEAVGRGLLELSKAGLSPDLIVVDGGRGQLSLAKEALNEHGYGAVPTIGIAKKHSSSDFERVILPDEDTPLILPEYAPALKLLKRLRNEAHRFAVTFHRKRRQKRALASWLDNVKGVGRLTKKRLLMRFATPRSLLDASYEDLADAIHTTPKRALSLKRALQEVLPSS